jgi:NAD(P)-dependent dehydrogenase (short-subunit alcohol dehydrogenase family)
MTIADKAVLVTGANRGIGQALVEEALRRARSECMPVRASPWSTRMGASRP